MSKFLGSTIFFAGLLLFLILGFTSWNERSDGSSIRRTCEAENITDIQTHECVIRLTMLGGPNENLGRR